MTLLAQVVTHEQMRPDEAVEEREDSKFDGVGDGLLTVERVFKPSRFWK